MAHWYIAPTLFIVLGDYYFGSCQLFASPLILDDAGTASISTSFGSSLWQRIAVAVGSLSLDVGLSLDTDTATRDGERECIVSLRTTAALVAPELTLLIWFRHTGWYGISNYRCIEGILFGTGAKRGGSS